MEKHIVINSANDLPPQWDQIAHDNIFLTKKMLTIFEKHNPCSQQYHLFYNNGLDSIIVTYKLKLDILTYRTLGLRIPVTIVGIPASVSSQGYVIGERTKQSVHDFLRSIKGGKIILNSNSPLNTENSARGNTLPSCKMVIKWSSFDGYLQSLRSSYRYRFKKALSRFRDVTVSELLDNKDFDQGLYQLYLKVYNKSKYKLEKMPLEYFREGGFRIISFYIEGKPLGFVQLLENKSELIFVLGGFDYEENFKYDVYLNMLLTIIKIALDNGFKSIEMGQTAEDTKLKLGCTLQKKYMEASHSHSVINYGVGKGINSLSYKSKDMSFNTFKGE